LVVIDTIARAVVGDENDADTFRNYYRYTASQLKAAGVAIVRLDNTGHNTEHARGSAAKADDIDLEYRLNSPGHGEIRLVTTRSRVQSTQRTFIILREEDPITRHVLRPQDYVAGTQECGQLLDELSVDLNASITIALAALRNADKGRRKQVVVDALRWRRTRR